MTLGVLRLSSPIVSEGIKQQFGPSVRCLTGNWSDLVLQFQTLQFVTIQRPGAMAAGKVGGRGLGGGWWWPGGGRGGGGGGSDTKLRKDFVSQVS